jgi:surfactin synthase thioesterase subunit
MVYHVSVYTNNVNLQVPLIIFWGSKDPVFVPAGADAYKRDVPNVHIKHLDAGHFLLETHLVRLSIIISAT